MATKKRKTKRSGRWLNVRLYDDEHSDIIEWFESLPARKRGDVVRDLIRAHLAEKSPASLYNEVLRRLEAIDRKIAQGVTVAAPSQGMDDSTADKMRANLRKATW